MARATTVLPVPAWAEGSHRPLRPGSGEAGVSLAVVLACLLISALTVAGAALRTPIAIGQHGVEGADVECVGYQDSDRLPGTTHLAVWNPGPDSVGLEVRYLDLDRTVLRSEALTLEGGAVRELTSPTREAGYAALVRSSGAVRVSSYVTSWSDGGEERRRQAACSVAGRAL